MNEHDHKPDTPSTDVPETHEAETATPDSVETAADSMAEVAAPTGELSTTHEVADVSETTPEAAKADEEVDSAEEKDESNDDIVSETAATAMASASAFGHKAKHFVCKYKYTIIAAVLVLVGLVGFTYMLEKEGRINTGAFDAVNTFIASQKTVAKVNGHKITQKDLDVSTSQLQMGAAAQGVDTTDPKMIDQIRTQAIDMLVNTELLKQEAANRGVNITSEDVDKRLESLKGEIGGEDVLKERMTQFGVDEKTLRRDIQNELTIQGLLDQVFAEKGITVSEEEITAFYKEAGGEKAGLPKLEEVKDQIETQIKSTKQQDVVSSYLEELKKKATIEMI